MSAVRKLLIGALAVTVGSSGIAYAGIIVPVDLELVLAVDVSGSVDSTEFAFQRDGYAAAFQDPSLTGLFTGGRSIATTFVYWAGDGVQVQAVPWTQISSAGEAQAFATAIGATPRPIGGLPDAGQTGVSRALDFSVGLFTDDFDGTRRLIDISGDGSENLDLLATIPPPIADIFVPGLSVGDLTITGPDPRWGAVVSSRNAALAAGIGINGLFIESGLTNDAGLVTDLFSPPTLDLGVFTPADQVAVDAAFSSALLAQFGSRTVIEWFYRDFLIGAPGGSPDPLLFAAADFDQSLADAIRGKIIAEIVPEPASGLMLGAALAAFAALRLGRYGSSS